MRYILLLLYGLTLAPFAFSQVYDTLSVRYLKENNFKLSTSIADYPKSDYPANADFVVLGTKRTESSHFVSLLFSINDSTYLKFPSLELYDLDTFDCDEEQVIYEDGDLKIECRWMRGLIYGERFEVIENRLYYQGNYTYDLNEGIHAEVIDAQMNNDPIAYCNAYMGAQYYFELIDAKIQESLLWAYEQALEFAEQNAYSEAANLMHKIEMECDLSLSESVADLFPEEFKNIWCNSALFYLKADMNKECVTLSKSLIKLFPDLAEIHLYYGDALFNLGKISECKAIYATYIELMEATENSDDVPSRAVERIRD